MRKKMPIVHASNYAYLICPSIGHCTKCEKTNNGKGKNKYNCNDCYFAKELAFSHFNLICKIAENHGISTTFFW